MRAAATLVVVVVALAAGCAEQQEPAPTPVENPALGVRIDDLPDGFTVVRNAGPELELAPATEDITGRVVVRVGPPETGVNLVAAIQQHQAVVEARPDGIYHGARELEGPLGTAFYSRGSWTADDGSRVEETLVTAIHPSRDRRLDLVYSYPAGADSGERVTALIGLLAEIEGLTPSAG
jgi:hypothetical protein